MAIFNTNHRKRLLPPHLSIILDVLCYRFIVRPYLFLQSAETKEWFQDAYETLDRIEYRSTRIELTGRLRKCKSGLQRSVFRCFARRYFYRRFVGLVLENNALADRAEAQIGGEHPTRSKIGEIPCWRTLTFFFRPK
jgi:hypothetical protein